jgi:hypothetical protein
MVTARCEHSQDRKVIIGRRADALVPIGREQADPNRIAKDDGYYCVNISFRN